jgi:hypothetical protein
MRGQELPVNNIHLATETWRAIDVAVAAAYLAPL